MDELVRAPSAAAIATSAKYQVQLAEWSGPYDVLLQVIDDQELDLLNLDISILLEHYILYLETCPIIDIEEAGEFLLVAATLAQIKSKLLLPKEEQTEDLDEKDPREDLVRYLIEYQKIKQAADLLRDRPILGRDVFLKGTREQFEGMESDGRGTLFQLVRGFQKAMKELRAHTRMDISREEISVSVRLQEILFQFASAEGSSRFLELLQDSSRSKTYIIVTFLAVLELIRLKKIKITPVVDSAEDFYLQIGDSVSLESHELLQSEFDTGPNEMIKSLSESEKSSEEMAV